MAYTLAALITEVRALLNEPTASFWSDAEITQWLLQAAVDVSTKAHCVEEIMTLAVTPSVSRYVLPANTVGVDSVLAGPQALVKLRPRSLGQIHGGEDPHPTHFAVFGFTLWLFGPPQQALDLLVNRWVRASDPVLLPDTYQQLAIDYAVVRAKLKDRKYTEAAQLYQLYLQSLLFQRQDLQDYQPDSREMLGIPDRIVSAQNGR